MLRKLSLLVACLWSFTAQAIMVDDLYTVRLPVSDLSGQGQLVLMQQGLGAVLSRISGRTDITTLPVVAKALEEAGQYVQQFTIEEGQYFAHYDPERLSQLLSSAGVPVWGENRPLTLMWLTVESADGRKLVGSEAKTYAQAIDQASKALGLPVMLPLLDLEDVAAVSVTDVQGRFAHILEPASERYASDAILAVRLLERAPNQWEGRWYLKGGEEQFDWLVDTPTLDEQLSKGLAAVAEHLASGYAVDQQNAPGEPVSLLVNDIHSAQQYAEVLAYLNGLAPVSAVQVGEVRGNSVVFKVTPIGGNQALRQAISLDHHLLAMGEQHYRWIP